MVSNLNGVIDESKNVPKTSAQVSKTSDKKSQIFLPVRGNLVFVCNLPDVRYSVAFNGVKSVVVDVA